MYFWHSWEEYHTGLFSTAVNDVGGTEFQLQVIVIILLPVFIPHETLQSKIFFHMNTPELVTFILIISGLVHLYYSLKTIIPKVKLSAYKDLFPILFISISEGLLCFTNLFKQKTIEMMVFNGIIYGFYCLKYILCIMTKVVFILIYRSNTR